MAAMAMPPKRAKTPAVPLAAALSEGTVEGADSLGEGMTGSFEGTGTGTDEEGVIKVVKLELVEELVVVTEVELVVSTALEDSTGMEELVSSTALEKLSTALLVVSTTEEVEEETVERVTIAVPELVVMVTVLAAPSDSEPSPSTMLKGLENCQSSALASEVTIRP